MDEDENADIQNEEEQDESGFEDDEECHLADMIPTTPSFVHVPKLSEGALEEWKNCVTQTFEARNCP